jgi:hypothetical protein
MREVLVGGDAADDWTGLETAPCFVGLGGVFVCGHREPAE